MGVDLASGPAFVWWELGLGMIAIAGGTVALLAVRRRAGPPALRAAGSIVIVGTIVLGATLAMRSFRAA